jgi:hypothetical protein
MILSDYLTIITPVKLDTDEQKVQFGHMMDSHYNMFGRNKPQHLFSPAGTFRMKAFANSGVVKRNPEARDIPGDTTALRALNDLVYSVTTPYTHISTVNTIAIGHKKKHVLKLGVMAMLQDPTIYQVRHGEIPPLDEKNVSGSLNIETPWGYETVWKFPKVDGNIGLRSCTFRTEVLVKLAEAVDSARDSGTLDDWLEVAGRPESDPITSGLFQGVINLTSYVYSPTYDVVPLEVFKSSKTEKKKKEKEPKEAKAK